MKTLELRRPVVAAVVVVMAFLVSPAPGGATAVRGPDFTGQFAQADFFSFDPTGCIETHVVVIAQQPRPGPASAALAIRRFDDCVPDPDSPTFLLNGEGSATLGKADFQMDGGLSSATLNSTIQVSDELSGTSFPVDVSIAWTGTGDVTRVNSHSHAESPGVIKNDHVSFMLRQAQASGTVSDGTTNFTPEPSFFAAISSGTRGQVTIQFP